MPGKGEAEDDPSHMWSTPLIITGLHETHDTASSPVEGPPYKPPHPTSFRSAQGEAAQAEDDLSHVWSTPLNMDMHDTHDTAAAGPEPAGGNQLPCAWEADADQWAAAAKADVARRAAAATATPTTVLAAAANAADPELVGFGDDEGEGEEEEEGGLASLPESLQLVALAVKVRPLAQVAGRWGLEM